MGKVNSFIIAEESNAAKDVLRSLNEYIGHLLSNIGNPFELEVNRFWVEDPITSDMFRAVVRASVSDRVYSSYLGISGQQMELYRDRAQVLHYVVKALGESLLEEVLKQEIGYTYSELYRKKMEKLKHAYSDPSSRAVAVISDPSMPRNRVAILTPAGDSAWIDNVGREPTAFEKFKEAQKRRAEKSKWGKCD